MREGEWKLLINADGSGVELYNVVHDRTELKNVAAEHAEIVRRMSELALRWRNSLPALNP
jgi:hypothetical protein